MFICTYDMGPEFLCYRKTMLPWHAVTGNVQARRCYTGIFKGYSTKILLVFGITNVIDTNRFSLFLTSLIENHNVNQNNNLALFYYGNQAYVPWQFF